MLDPALREQVIRRLLASSDAKLNASEIGEATRLRQDLDLSSLILVTLASELEDDLGIQIDDESLAGIETLGDLLRILETSPRRKQAT